MSKRDELIELREEALSADLPLKGGATRLVFGEGNPNAEILFLGEAPGHWEDVKGLPFVGNAGALLNQMLAQIKIERKEVFITNIIMYRPPENRDPTIEELMAFEKYVDGIIETIDPKLIVTLGRFSMGKFLPGVMISAVHGKLKEVEWKGNRRFILPMYHPAAALRSTAVKDSFKNDFLTIPQVLENIKAKSTTSEENKSEEEKKEESKQMKLV